MQRGLHLFCITVFAVILLVLVGMLFDLFEISPVDAVTSGQTVQISVAQTITLTLATSSVSLAALTPGTPVTATTSLNVTTNSGTGWNLSTKRDDATSTLDLIADATVDFPDFTAWNSSGSGNAATSTGATLSFRVNQTGTTPSALFNTTWWGANDTDGTAKYAGFPGTSDKIAENTSYASTTQTVVYKFRADAPTAQRSGSYDGTITKTAVVNP